jgi:hypothetical protein
MNRKLILPLGLAAVVAETALLHGPLGAGERVAAKIERAANTEIKRLELPLVRARIERGPLTRNLILAGPADSFQQPELARILSSISGIGDARWTTPAVASEAPQ